MDNTLQTDKVKGQDDKKNVENEQFKLEVKIASLKRVPPKRGMTLDSLRPSSSRFQLDTPQKTEETARMKDAVPLPNIVFKPSISQASSTPLQTSISVAPTQKLEFHVETKPRQISSSIFKPNLSKEPSRLSETKISSSSKSRQAISVASNHDDDPCKQFNFFKISNLSCYIDSLLFSLLHKLENNFVIDLKRSLQLELEHNSVENCKIRVITAIVSFYEQIHDKTHSIKRTLSEPFRELLYECDPQRQTTEIHREFYTNSEQDPHDFFSKILNIIENSQAECTVIKEYTHPIGTKELIETFGEYNTENKLKTYNSILIYSQSDKSEVIDIGFEQIDENIFKFTTPVENVEFERATEDYPKIVEFIYNHNLIDSSVIEKFKESDPYLLDFFKPDTDSLVRCALYELMCKKNIMVFSQKENKEIKHYIYNDDLPKLTFTRSTHSTIFNNPLNYFVISITRETDSLHRNTMNLINLPERILSYGKTLELVSAIVHYGVDQSHGHYVCYFKCGNNWYIMDNMQNNITQYATFDIRNPEIMTKCRMLVYM